jgi:hypothetical protein
LRRWTDRKPLELFEEKQQGDQPVIAMDALRAAYWKLLPRLK